MSTPVSPLISATAANAAGTAEFAKPRNEAEAAKQFEALLIGQMLRTAHQSGADSGMGSADSGGDTMWDVSAQQFAQVLANNGGMGLAHLITQGLHDRASAQKTLETTTETGTAPVSAKST